MALPLVEGRAVRCVLKEMNTIPFAKMAAATVSLAVTGASLAADANNFKYRFHMNAALKKTTRAKSRKNVLGRDAWLTAARTALIREGIGGVEVGKLARKLRATRGGFYWFFTSRKQLLDLLIEDWEHTNTAKFKEIVAQPGSNGMAEFRALVKMWINEEGYDPQWDAAVREWARISPRVAAVVHRVDDVRIAILQRIFEDMGYQNPEAFVRARISYFHQVGYYTLGVKESRDRRFELLPLYIRQLTGFEP